MAKKKAGITRLAFMRGAVGTMLAAPAIAVAFTAAPKYQSFGGITVYDIPMTLKQVAEIAERDYNAEPWFTYRRILIERIQREDNTSKVLSEILNQCNKNS